LLAPPPPSRRECFLAIGTSVPDAIASVGAARGGDADMVRARAASDCIHVIGLGCLDVLSMA